MCVYVLVFDILEKMYENENKKKINNRHMYVNKKGENILTINQWKNVQYYRKNCYTLDLLDPQTAYQYVVVFWFLFFKVHVVALSLLTNYTT